jgi:HK97 family phage major capsid protein
MQSDNVDEDIAAWACEKDSFVNNDNYDFTNGLGEVEIIANSIRASICIPQNLFEDSAIDLQSWIKTKVGLAIRDKLSYSFFNGDGVNKPQGFMRKNSGVKPCLAALDASGAPTGQFTWQDLITLKYQVPTKFHNSDAAFMMNVNTYAKVLTMSDATSRPLMLNTLAGSGSGAIDGSPIKIVSQMPNIVVGGKPVAFANLKEGYTVVRRKAMSYSRVDMNFKARLNFEARFGGLTTCPKAIALLEIQ